MSNVRQSSITSRDEIEILNQCLQAIERRQATVETCVARYPDFAELSDLLHAAMFMQELPQPSLAMQDKAAIRQQVLAQYQSKSARKTKPSMSVPRWFRVVLIASLSCLFLFWGSGIVARAAKSAVPGDGLYGLKRAIEQVPLLFADAPERSVILRRLAYTRLAEMSRLSSRGIQLNEAVLADTLQGIDLALVVQTDTTERDQLVNEAVYVLEDARAKQVLDETSKNQMIVSVRIASFVDNLVKMPNYATDTPLPNTPAVALTGVLPAVATSTIALTSNPGAVPMSVGTELATGNASATDTSAEDATEVSALTASPTQTPEIANTAPPTIEATGTPIPTITTTAQPPTKPMATPGNAPTRKPNQIPPRSTAAQTAVGSNNGSSNPGGGKGNGNSNPGGGKGK